MYMPRDWSSFVRKKLQKGLEITFTKEDLDWLTRRNGCSIQDMEDELRSPDNMVFVERQEVEFRGRAEVRFRCYFVYSGNKGRCFIIIFDDGVKVLTAFPLGRTTLRRYRRKFK